MGQPAYRKALLLCLAAAAEATKVSERKWKAAADEALAAFKPIRKSVTEQDECQEILVKSLMVLYTQVNRKCRLRPRRRRRPRDGERLGPRRRLLPRAAAPVQSRPRRRRRLDEDRFAGRGALAERPRARRDLAGLSQQGRLLPAHESSALRVCGGAAAAPLAPGRALGEVPGARELGVAQGRGPPVALRGPEPAGPRAVHGGDGVPVGPRVRR